MTGKGIHDMAAIKFGICGLGRIGTVHARCFSQEKDKYELVAGCDREAERTRTLQTDYGCTVYNDFAEFLRNPDMELVIIATRSLDHVANAEQALAAGKLVLLEKPIAVTSDDFKRLKKLNRKYPGKLFFLHNHLIHSPVKDIWSDLKHINALGDADDHVKIMLVGENGTVADLEISNAVALPDAYCTVYGNRGSLVCADEKTIQLKYIDPEYKLPERCVADGLPPPDGGMGRDEDLHWIEKTVAVEPGGNMWEIVEFEIARHLYRAIRENVPFPVRNADALEVVRVTEVVKKQNPQFNWE